MTTTDLRLGRYADVLSGETWDALVCDPPYGARVHDGNSADRLTERFAEGAARRTLSYDCWTHEDVAAFVDWAHPRTRGWMVAFTSHDLIPAWETAYVAHGRQAFAPVPFLQHRPRLAGDGPGSGACYIMVARPKGKAWLGWGSLPCWYHGEIDRGGHIGGKPLSVMHAIVRDYSRPGDVVCDPTAGLATTLVAARALGRVALGAEQDPATHAKALERLERPWQPMMVEAPAEARQEVLV